MIRVSVNSGHIRSSEVVDNSGDINARLAIHQTQTSIAHVPVLVVLIIQILLGNQNVFIFFAATSQRFQAAILALIPFMKIFQVFFVYLATVSRMYFGLIL